METGTTPGPPALHNFQAELVCFPHDPQLSKKFLV